MPNMVTQPQQTLPATRSILPPSRTYRLCTWASGRRLWRLTVAQIVTSASALCQQGAFASRPTRCRKTAPRRRLTPQTCYRTHPPDQSTWSWECTSSLSTASNHRSWNCARSSLSVYPAAFCPSSGLQLQFDPPVHRPLRRRCSDRRRSRTSVARSAMHRCRLPSQRCFLETSPLWGSPWMPWRGRSRVLRRPCGRSIAAPKESREARRWRTRWMSSSARKRTGAWS